MAWFKDPALRIVGMAFNHSAQWLVCVASDMSIFVLSIYFMMVRDNMTQPLKVIQTTRYSREKKFHFSDVKCWRSGAGVEYAIITTTPGNVRLINLQNGEFFKVKAKTSLGKFHILRESGGAESRPSTWLLIESPGHGFYRLLIGQYLDSGKYEDITAPNAFTKPEFAFYNVSIATRSPNAHLSVQQSSRGPIVLIFDPEAKTLQLLDSNLRLLFRYNVNISNAEVKSVHVTENLIFVLTNSSTDTSTPNAKLLVFSRILSEEKRPPPAPYQEFSLPIFERIGGPFFPGFARPIFPSAPSTDESSPQQKQKQLQGSNGEGKNESHDAEPAPLSSGSASIAIGMDSPSHSSAASSRAPLKFRPKSIRSYVEVSPLALRAAVRGGLDELPPNSSQFGLDSSSNPNNLANSEAQNMFSFKKIGGAQSLTSTGLAPEQTSSSSQQASTSTSTTSRTSNERRGAQNSNSAIFSSSSVVQPASTGSVNKPLIEFLDERGELAYEESWIDEAETEGVYFWTEDSLYELRATRSPEELFFRLMEKKQGEALGLTFALDMCKLYELAADERFGRGQLGEAAALYHLSNVSTPKLIRQWLSVGRMDEPISTLRVLLMSGKVGEARRPRVAHELIRCHVQRLLNPSKHSNLLKLLNVNDRCKDEELETFLKNNPDFDEMETRNFFAKFGLLRFDLIVAQAKRHLKAALNTLSIQRGLSYLSMEHLRFISDNNAIESGTLKTDDANTLISHFPPHIQLLHYLTAASNIQNTLPRIHDLLSELDDVSLSKICRFFDPQGPFVGPMIHSQDHAHQQQQQQQQMRTQSPQRRLQEAVDNENASSSAPSASSASALGSMQSGFGGVHSNTSKSAGVYLDSRHFVSQCVELFLAALIRLNRNSNALPQSWVQHCEQQTSQMNASTNRSSDSPHTNIDGAQSGSKRSRSNSVDVPVVGSVPGGGRSSMKSSSDSVDTNPRSESLSSLSGSESGTFGTLAPQNVSQQANLPSLEVKRPNAADLMVLSPRRRAPAGLEMSSSTQALRGLKLRKAVSVHCGFHHTALLTETGQVFTWGAGSKGQLGHENVSDSLWVPRLVSGLCPNPSFPDKVIKLACGANHTMALTASGQLYAFGSNARGQLGLGDREDRFEPRQVILGEQIRLEMASSTGASSNSFGQTQNQPSVGTLVDISAGFWHSVIVTDKGVWIAGANSTQDASAAAGLHSDNADLLSFAPVPNIPLDETYVMARCGFAHTVLLTKRGRVYTFGSNEYGQLGIGDFNGDATTWNSRHQSYDGDGESSSNEDTNASHSIRSFSPSPVHVRGLLADKHVIHIACGSFSTFAVSEVYSVYAWGQNSKRGLGFASSSSSSSSSPYSASNSSGSASSKTRKKSKSSSGGGADGASGSSHGNASSSANDDSDSLQSTNERLPIRIDALQGLEITKIYAGPSHAFATSSNGKIYVWGECNTTMKAVRSTNTADPRAPTPLNRWTDAHVASFGCGDDFSVAVLDNGLVYTFGRGIYGQLGHNDENDFWEARQAFLNTSLAVESSSADNDAPPVLTQYISSNPGVSSDSPVPFVHSPDISSSILSSISEEDEMQGTGSKISSNVTINGNSASNFNPSSGSVSSSVPNSSSGLSSSYTQSTSSPMVNSSSNSGIATHSTGVPSTPINLSASSTAVATYSNPALLEHSLHVLAKRFRPAIILQYCYVAGNLSAAALVLEQSRAWDAAIDCKIRLLQREFPKIGDNVAHKKSLLTEMLKDLAQIEVAPLARLSGLKQVLIMWKNAGASQSDLESMLLSSPELTASMATILEQNNAPKIGANDLKIGKVDPSSHTSQHHFSVLSNAQDSSDKASETENTMPSFSPRFMLKIVKAKLESSQNQRPTSSYMGSVTPVKQSHHYQSSSSSRDASKPGNSKNSSKGQQHASQDKNSSHSAPRGIAASDPAWNERRATMEKDIKLRTKIQISQPALEDFIQHSSGQRGQQQQNQPNSNQFASNRGWEDEKKNLSTSGASQGTGDLVFTCGHMYSERRFNQSTLQLFRDKMGRFPVPLPLTVKLLIMDYSQPSCTSACPACVYNHLREKHAPTLERWNPQ